MLAARHVCSESAWEDAPGRVPLPRSAVMASPAERSFNGDAHRDYK